jgi:molybdopterin converting factor small subunit
MRNRIVTKTLKLSLVTGLVVLAYFFGAGIIPTSFDIVHGNDVTGTAEPFQPPTVEARLVETHTIEYIEETVIEREYVDVIQQVETEISNFKTLDELKGWMNNTYNQATIRFQQADTVIDCDDYAFEMQREALKDGYIISFEIISVSEYNELFSYQLPETGSLHAINLAIIGNSVYYIEPQTGETVHAAYLD